MGKPVDDPGQACAPSGSGQAPVILVVDDNPLDRRLASRLIEKAAEGWRVLAAENGIEALAVLKREPIAAVLTDLQMPELDGLQLVQRVRREHPGVPVLLMTAHGSEEVALTALRQGASGYVPKKSLAAELTANLRQVLAAAQIDRNRQRVLGCLSRRDSRFVLANDPALIQPLVAVLQEDLLAMRLCSEGDRIRVGIALVEALANALYHGNLEVSSQLKEQGNGYDVLAAQRRQLAPYCSRRLYVRAELTATEARYVVRDEGPGFDLSALPDPTDAANLARPSGRGLLLIRTFMDEVDYNAVGNEITLVKRRDADA